MSKLRVLDLFSGIGGFSLGLERSGAAETVAFCEQDKFCRSILRKHWPGKLMFNDVRWLHGNQTGELRYSEPFETSYRYDVGRVDLICGGFPCQDISRAGKGAGHNGERSGLWRELTRLVGEIRPRYVLMENSPALLDGGLGDILGELASLGYDALWHCIQAADVGARHIRDRVWILGHLPDASGEGLEQCWREQFAENSDTQRNIRHWFAQPEPPRVADGVPHRLDRTGACGNAVVPQIPELIGHVIKSSGAISFLEAAE